MQEQIPLVHNKYTATTRCPQAIPCQNQGLNQQGSSMSHQYM